ncbi:hypothetical protein BLNAU_835 [Blattamonas nauphoetae]|uniref:Uncharacterized protein n=1 Tax=Blattamonas nauphoetae TaxID=2049346 RepID=A0ABQ9YKM8_9EUKA|nr:hypothetical protein BLNAU_835 [Blattamonas nauphoetae]
MKLTSATLKMHTVSLSSFIVTSASVTKLITQTGSGGGAFLRMCGDKNQIVSITSSLFGSVSSTGDAGVILAGLGPESKLPD